MDFNLTWGEWTSIQFRKILFFVSWFFFGVLFIYSSSATAKKNILISLNALRARYFYIRVSQIDPISLKFLNVISRVLFYTFFFSPSSAEFQRDFFFLETRPKLKSIVLHKKLFWVCLSIHTPEPEPEHRAKRSSHYESSSYREQQIAKKSSIHLNIERSCFSYEKK